MSNDYVNITEAQYSCMQTVW